MENEDSVREEALRDMQVESIGRIIAGFSHEMKNHLGIIRESNGLVSDVLEFQGIGMDEAAVERMNRAVAAIEKRIVVAAEMLHHLSGFAHRSDTPLSSFNVNDLVAEECLLLERFSRLEQLSLDFVPGSDIPAVYSNPSLLQHIVYRLFVSCLKQAQAGATLKISTSRIGNRAAISFILSAQGIAGEDEDLKGVVEPALEKIGASLSVGEGEDGNFRYAIMLSSMERQ